MPIDLDELERLEKAATPGPWMPGGPWPTVTVCICVDPGSTHPEHAEPPHWEPVAYLHQCAGDYVTPPPDSTVADARLIAAMRNALPELLAAIYAERFGAENASRAAAQLAEALTDLNNEVRSVLMLMDGLAEQWGDEGVFRRCRDRLRKAVGEDKPTLRENLQAIRDAANGKGRTARTAEEGSATVGPKDAT